MARFRQSSRVARESAHYAAVTHSDYSFCGRRGDQRSTALLLSASSITLCLYLPRLAGGMMPFMRRYSTSWP
jgi:hypothetical protein